MTEHPTASDPARVVILSPRTTGGGELLRALAARGVQCVRANSVYEAVAEMLCEPTRALAIDLRLLGPSGLRCLAIAHERDVEVLAMGTVPRTLSAEDLSGVRLVAHADLPEMLANLPRKPDGPSHLEEEDGLRGEAEAPVPLFEGPPPRQEADEQSPSAVRLTPAKAPAPAPQPPEGAAQDGVFVSHPAPASARDVITPAELAALLESEP